MLSGPEAEEAKAAAAEVIKRVLEGDPGYERLNEARELLSPE